MTRICLIDDDLFILDALSIGLRDAGFEVVTAPGATAGLDIAARGGVDAIVTDMHMPGVGGAQLIAEARARWPKLPIVAISGASVIDGRDVGDVARDLGADFAMVKPFRARTLAEAIERALAARKTA
jgi:DNA-binding response OmpR family regulator